MFRSLAVAETTSQLLPSRQQQDATTPSFSDLMDVLIMVIPQFMHAAPSPNQLEIVARKLLPSDQNVATQVEVKRATLSTLIDLLLRVSLSEEKWAPVCHTGYFAEINSADDQFVKVLVDSLAKDGNDQNIVSTGLGRAAETMVSLMVSLMMTPQGCWNIRLTDINSRTFRKGFASYGLCYSSLQYPKLQPKFLEYQKQVQLMSMEPSRYLLLSSISRVDTTQGLPDTTLM